MTALVVIILAPVILLVIGVVVFFKFFYVQVAQSSALIINNQKVYFSNVVVLPTDKKELVELLPVQIKTSYLGSEGLLCKEKLLLDVVITYNLCVGFSPEAVLSAVSKVDVANITNSSSVSSALAVTIDNIVKTVIESFSLDTLEKDQGKVRKALASQLVGQLYGYQVEYINIDKIELTSLDQLEQVNPQLFSQQQDARLAWDIEQKKILEKRLKLIVEHQRDLSNKIKHMIESYQLIVREKIKVFLSKELFK